MAAQLNKYDYKLATGGTDNHLILWDLRPQGLTGSKIEYICDEVAITVNKNSIHGDTSALSPGGVRIGTCALTSRGFKEKDFEDVADFLHKCVLLAAEVQSTSGKALKAFKEGVHAHTGLKALREDVEKFARSFNMFGFDTAGL